jgi:hypothetical protein
MAPVMRRLVAASVLLAAGAGIGGCGKGQPTASVTVTQGTSATTTAQATKASPTAPAQASSQAKTRARAFANAVNLSANDLTGFTPSSEHSRHHETAREKHLGQELHACVGSGHGATQPLVEATSGEYERKGTLARQSVSSNVTVESSATLATEDLTALRNSRVRSCLSLYFEHELAGVGSQGARVTKVSTKYGSPPAPGTAGSFGLRITATLTFHRLTLPFYVDYLGFVDGPAEVSLVSMGTPLPFPASAEEQLFSLLVERAKTHSA